jgi:tRNA-specific 2-thiouridylase
VAAEARLPVADKPDSQDICFVPAGDYRAFVEPRLARRTPGDIVDGDGRVLGRHDGIYAFTVGQRKRLPLPGGSGGPLFVTAIDADTGAVTVGPAKSLLRRGALMTGASWTSGEPPASPRRVTACVRYRGEEAAASVRAERDGTVLEFDEPQRAITPGQAAVFYDGDELVGGGVIERALPDAAAAVTRLVESATAAAG